MYFLQNCLVIFSLICVLAFGHSCNYGLWFNVFIVEDYCNYFRVTPAGVDVHAKLTCDYSGSEAQAYVTTYAGSDNDCSGTEIISEATNTFSCCQDDDDSGSSDDSSDSAVECEDDCVNYSLLVDFYYDSPDCSGTSSDDIIAEYDFLLYQNTDCFSLNVDDGNMYSNVFDEDFFAVYGWLESDTCLAGLNDDSLTVLFESGCNLFETGVYSDGRIEFIDGSESESGSDSSSSA